MSRKNAEYQAVLIAGPTASGKSGLALEIAEAIGGVVVNADSMQVYDGLRILTARPTDADLGRAEHRLYGHVDPRHAYSTGQWLREASKVLGEVRAEGRVPIVCGGTGLYFKALLGGIDDMPPVPPAIRARWRDRMASEGSQALHAELLRRDPEAAERIRPGDPQRVLRALEIGEASGATLSALQRGRGEVSVDADLALKIVLTPARDILRARIAERFHAMIGSGALEEVRVLMEHPGGLGATAGRAIGVAEIAGHLAGASSLEDAGERAITRSRQYAKRQDTWFRHQLDASWHRVAGDAPIDLSKLIARVKCS